MTVGEKYQRQMAKIDREISRDKAIKRGINIAGRTSLVVGGVGGAGYLIGKKRKKRRKRA